VTIEPAVISTEGGVVMELVHIIVDFFALGIVGGFTVITLAVWWGFCETFIFEPGYFRFVNKHSILKALLVTGSGLTIWGGALAKIHQLLWE